MLFISTWTMDNCPTCQRHVLPHAIQVKCSTCHRIYHMKCISLNLNDQSYIQANRNTWYCVSCITTCFPFNHIENDDTFKVEISNLDIESKDIESLSQLLFNPFELNNDDIYSPLCDRDPDVNYYDLLETHVQQCNYYFENSFLPVIQNKLKYNNVFSLCHINIRSLKANLPSFEVCLENLGYQFSIIGMSETWLSEFNADL